MENVRLDRLSFSRHPRKTPLLQAFDPLAWPGGAEAGRIESVGMRMKSNRDDRLARVIAVAQDVLEDEQNARAWVCEPNRALRGERPLDLLDTEAGMERVVHVLKQLEHGVYT